MHYGGRQHIERLTNVLNALGDENLSGTPSREQQDALDALHAALLCQTRPVRCPPALVMLLDHGDELRTAYPVTSN
jgi:hypothetical protein